MGHETFYCHRCSLRVGGADVEKGKAFRIEGRIVCDRCLNAEEKGALLSPPSTRAQSTTRIRVPKPSPGTSTKLPPVPLEASPRSSSPLYVGIAVGAALVLGAGVWLLSGPSAPDRPDGAVRPPDPAAKALPPLPPEAKPEDPQVRDARAALEVARAKMKAVPADLDGQLAAWEEAARKAALTPLFKEASTGLQEVKTRLAAVKPMPPPLPEKPAPPPSPPDPAPKPADVGVPSAFWTAAMGKATAGDFDGAAADLGRGEGGNPLADELLQAKAALADSRSEVSRLTAGQPISVTYRSETGDRKRVDGTLLRGGPARLEIGQGEETVFVEITDICADSLAAICKPSEPLRRRYALLCLLEGEGSAAERLAGADAFPAQYWEYSKGAASKVPKAPARELEARRLYYAAEREFAKAETMSEAVLKYRALAENYADTALVKGEQVRIKTRADSGKDNLLTAYQLKATGTFGLAAAPRSEAAWTSKADIDGAQAVTNFVSAEFSALPNTTYRCWALVGACCAETFTFYLQTTEGTDLNPKTRKKESIEPGAGIASQVKHTIRDLAKSHRSHVTKIAKQPLRWEWIPIPLPKYAAAGQKKIHLVSDQQGFSVGAIAVFSTRGAPPSDAELKEEAAKAKSTLGDQGLSLETPGEKSWKPLFDGKTKESVIRGNAPGWKVENGQLLRIPEINDAAQTRENFTDGEVRIRFETQELQKMWFILRQNGGGYGVHFEGDLKALDGKPHDLIFKAKGESVTATLDGQSVPVAVEGVRTSGCLQFNAYAKRFAVISLDFRPLTP